MNSETNRIDLTGDSCACPAKESEQEYLLPHHSRCVAVTSTSSSRSNFRNWFTSRR